MTLDLARSRGRLTVEWFNPENGVGKTAGTTAGGARREFVAPHQGDAVLYLAGRA